MSKGACYICKGTPSTGHKPYCSRKQFGPPRTSVGMTHSRLYNLIALAVLVAAIGWLCWEGTR